MQSFFTSDFFAGNRRRLQAAIDIEAPLVVTANGLLQRGGDSAFPFQQDANFWYLTGIGEPDILLVIADGKEHVIIPGRGDSREAFDGAVDSSQITERSGIASVLDGQAGASLLADVLAGGRVATVLPPPAYIEQYGLYTNPARLRLIDQLKNIQADVELIDIAPQLVKLRMIKQPSELQAIQAAIDSTAAAIKAITAPANLLTYGHEYEIEADLSRAFRRSGASGHAFAPIVASGKRACTLHNVANTGTLAARELLILDVGAEVEQYAADITRTVAIGKPTPRQQAVFDAVLDVQRQAMALLKPGMLIKEYERQVEALLGVQLQKLGLIDTNEHDAVRHYYPHAASHHLGLNVHDAADYRLPLQAGMVLTVEPGIYIPEEAIGVRIEDDVLVTDDGIKVMSGSLPRRLA